MKPTYRRSKTTARRRTGSKLPKYDVYYKRSSVFVNAGVQPPQVRTSTGISARRSFWYWGGESKPYDFTTPTYYAWEVKDHDYREGSFRVYKSDGVTEYQSWTGLLSSIVGSNTGWRTSFTPINSVWNEALARLYGEIKQSDLNLATSLAEGRESVGMVSDLLRSATKLVRLARLAKRDPVRFAKEWGATKKQLKAIRRNPSVAVTQAWLSAKLGWMPLVQDIYGVLEHNLARLQKGIVVKGSKRRVIEERGFGLASFGSFSTRARYRVYEVQHVKFSTRWTTVDETLHELRRLTSLNPVAIAWELTPLSFVADYFVNIGGYLELLEDATVNGLKFLSGSSARYQELTWSCQTIPERVRGNTEYAVIDSRESDTFRQYERLVLTVSPKPMLPVFEPSVGLQRVLTMLSLVRNLLLPRKL